MDSAKKWPKAWRRLSLLVALVTAALAGLGGIVVGGQSASAGVRHSIPTASSVQQAMPGTWTVQNLPAGVNNLIDVSCPTSSVCAATAQTSFTGSMLVSTTDSGQSGLRGHFHLTQAATLRHSSSPVRPPTAATSRLLLQEINCLEVSSLQQTWDSTGLI